MPFPAAMRTKCLSVQGGAEPQPSTRDISIRIVALFAGALLAGCGGTASDGAGLTAGPLTCHQPTPESAAVPECAPTSLCLGATETVAVGTTACSAQTCRWTFAEDVGDTLTYDGGDAWVFLRFGSSIAGATTTDQLLAAGPSVNFYVTFPATGATGLTATYFEQRTGAAAFDQLELSGGKLHVKLSFTVHDPYSWVVTSGSPSSDLCGDTTSCVCTYAGVSMPATIEVDLPADVPSA